jgi:hypothetical protein
MEKKLPPEAPAIEVEAPRRLPIQAKCGNCFYGKVVPGMDGQLDVTKRTCFARPPNVFAVPAMISPNGQIGCQIMTVFPQPASDMRCHDWAPQDRDVDAGIGLIGGAKAN